jgi:hypothetical protein
MGKAGEKQKRRPKLKDKKQSERFKEAARELGADQPTEAFERILGEMARAIGDKTNERFEAEVKRRKLKGDDDGKGGGK